MKRGEFRDLVKVFEAMLDNFYEDKVYAGGGISIGPRSPRTAMLDAIQKFEDEHTTEQED